MAPNFPLLPPFPPFLPFPPSSSSLLLLFSSSSLTDMLRCEVGRGCAVDAHSRACRHTAIMAAHLWTKLVSTVVWWLGNAVGDAVRHCVCRTAYQSCRGVIAGALIVIGGFRLDRPLRDCVLWNLGYFMQHRICCGRRFRSWFCCFTLNLICDLQPA